MAKNKKEETPINKVFTKIICSKHNEVELECVYYRNTGILEVRPCYKCTWVDEPAEHRMGL